MVEHSMSLWLSLVRIPMLTLSFAARSNFFMSSFSPASNRLEIAAAAAAREPAPAAFVTLASLASARELWASRQTPTGSSGKFGKAVGLSADDVVRLPDTPGYFDLIKLPYPAERGAVLERFTSERLIRQREGLYEITNLGALLFAKDLDEFDGLSRKAPRVIVYTGKGKLSTRSDQFIPKGYAVGFETLVRYVNAQLPSNEIIGQALRETTRMYPEIAVRELIANALIHQDFSETGTSDVIELYSDRLEIASPGQPSIKTERFIDGYRSRNERLADLMRRLRICEEKGSGIDKVIDSVEHFQLPAPDFRVSETHTTVVLFAQKAFDEMDRNDKVRACYQHCCLRYVMGEKMTNQSLRERFKLGGAKADQVSRIIRETVNAGQIKPDDPENASKRYSKYVPFWA